MCLRAEIWCRSHHQQLYNELLFETHHLICNHQDVRRRERQTLFAYIIESYPGQLHSKIFEMLQSAVGKDFGDRRMPMQQLQNQSLVIQEGVVEGERCSRLFERHGLIGSYSSSFVH